MELNPGRLRSALLAWSSIIFIDIFRYVGNCHLKKWNVRWIYASFCTGIHKSNHLHIGSYRFNLRSRFWADFGSLISRHHHPSSDLSWLLWREREKASQGPPSPSEETPSFVGDSVADQCGCSWVYAGVSGSTGWSCDSSFGISHCCAVVRRVSSADQIKAMHIREKTYIQDVWLFTVNRCSSPA